MAVSCLSPLSEFNMNDGSLNKEKTETEVESVDDYSSSNEAENEPDAMEDDDVLEITELKTPFVDLTEHPGDDPNSATNDEVNLTENEDQIDLTEGKDEEAGESETIDRAKIDDIENIEISEEQAASTDDQEAGDSSTRKPSDDDPAESELVVPIRGNAVLSDLTNQLLECSKSDDKPDTECKSADDQNSSSRVSDTENDASETAPTDMPLSTVRLNRCDSIEDTMEESIVKVKQEIIDDVSKSLFLRKMHHAHRTKECTVVPRNHFGPVPGVEVGTCWRFRLSVSEAGVHRPLVAGIHGRSSEGAYSIVLSGIYDDDQDFGDHFLYCGSGGRAKDPTKRYSAQIAHQKLENGNRALALNCNAPFNDKEGAEAEDWQGGKPVRVIRNYRLSKHSEFAPKVGNRYDGIYKVVKYFPTIGKVGFIVWKFLMRRDDPVPAPWTEEGKKLIEEHNLTTLIWPDDYCPDGSPLPVLPKLSSKRRSEGDPQAVRRSTRKRRSTRPKNSDSEDDDDEFDSDSEMNRTSRKRRSTMDPDFHGSAGKRVCDFDRSARRLRSDAPERRMVKFGYIKCEGGGQAEVAVPEPGSGTQTNGTNEEPEDVKPNVKELEAGLLRRGRSRKRLDASPAKDDSSAASQPEESAPQLRTSRRSKRIEASKAGATSETSDMLTVDEAPLPIQVKVEPFDLPDNVRPLMLKDTPNKKFWTYSKRQLKKGEVEYLNYIKQAFTCRVCSKMVNCPVTLPCEHNACKKCIEKNFSKKVFTCPQCEADLGSSFEITENENLINILRKLFPNNDTELSKAN